ncbi:MAG TPA: hypothetical protein VM555_04530, partial [Tahibacter sp.]|nr:hypothetical protein [Tahibacter sp.]
GAGTGYVVLPGMYAPEAQTSDYVSSIALTQNGALEANDSITISGYTRSKSSAFLIRLTKDGALDTTFGGTGSVIVADVNSGGQRTGAGEIRAARIDDAGRVVALGSAGDRGYVFLRYNANGAPDATFGTNGRTLVKWSNASNYDEGLTLALQGNGKIVAAGFAPNIVTGQTAHNDFLVVRLQANGQPDPVFGADAQGRKLVVYPASVDVANAIAIEPSGNVLVGGYAQANGSATTDFAVTRLYGDPDRLFMDDFDPSEF